MQNKDTTINSIQADLLAHAYSNISAMLFVNSASSIGAAYIFSAYNKTGAWYFLSISLTLALIRFYKSKQFLSEDVVIKASAPRHFFWLRNYAFWLYFAAVLWSTLACASIFLASKDVQYPIIIIISALAGGATAVTAPLKSVGKIYITLLLFPLGVALAFNPTPNFVLSVLDFLFLIVMLITQNNNHKIVKDSFSLRIKNTSLIDDLKDINNNLEYKVDSRTQALKTIANNDALTGIANRRGLMEWMDKNLNASDDLEASILFLDLDRFKEINDAKGHEMGDQLLKMTALRFQDCINNDAILARWGGDEFIIATKQRPSSRSNTQNLAERLIETISTAFKINGEALSVGLSVGCAFYPTDASSFKEIIHAADLAAAEVKRTGRGKMLTFHQRFAETQRYRFELSRALSDAISAKEISVAYQPIINAKTGNIAAFEALARWNHAGKAVNPQEFISLAEETDRIVALGYLILEKTCGDAAAWLKAGNNQKVAVNISVKQLLTEDFNTQLTQILNKTKLPYEQLVLEVTESLFDDNHIDIIFNTVKQLKALGINTQIDDFGTGYSSLSRLHQFPISTIKIDRSFIAQIHNQGHAIIESTILIARNFNLDVVAEGVETLEQARELYSMGVDYFQGFYFSRPLSEPIFNDFNRDWQTK